MFKAILKRLCDYYRTQITYLYRDWDSSQETAFREWLYCWGLEIHELTPVLTRQENKK